MTTEIIKTNWKWRKDGEPREQTLRKREIITEPKNINEHIKNNTNRNPIDIVLQESELIDNKELNKSFDRQLFIDVSRELEKKKCNEREKQCLSMSERSQISHTNMNPFHKSNYLDDLDAECNFLRPKNSSFESQDEENQTENTA